MKALVKYGQLIKSIYIPRYLCDPQLQRRVGRQLNKGEAIHDLRHFLMFANEGKIRKSQLDDQTNQAKSVGFAFTFCTHTGHQCHNCLEYPLYSSHY